MTPSRILNILMLNLHSAQNTGDAALLETAVSRLLAAFPGATVVLAMNEPDAIYAHYWPGRVSVVSSFVALCGAGNKAPRIGALLRVVLLSLAAALGYRSARLVRRPPAWLPAELRNLLSAYMAADVVVSCPGNIFATMGRVGMPFLLAAFTIGYALMLAKPLYVLPQSIGPLKRRWERAVVRVLYSRARCVFVREPVSLRLAQEIGLPSGRLHMAPDMAFALPAAPREEALARLSVITAGVGPRVGVTVINRLLRHVGAEVWERYETALADALAGFARAHDATVVFFPQVIGPSAREDDRVVARRIAARMGSSYRTIVIEEQARPELLKAMYGGMDLVVATRMHSAIFALSSGVPTLMIEYLHKVRGLAEMLDLERWTLSLTEVDAGRLGEALEALWEDRETVRQRLDEMMPEMVQQVESVSETIVRDYYPSDRAA